MTRKMAWTALSYMAGLLAAFVLKDSLSAAAAVTAAAAAVFLLFFKKRRNIPAAVCCFAAAAGIINFSLQDVCFYRKAAALDGETAMFSGTVISASYLSEGRTSFTLKGKLNESIPAGVILISDSVRAETGDKLTFYGTPKKFEDTYAYNSETYNKAKGIYLTFYSADNYSVVKKEHSLLRAAENYKNRIFEVIDDYMPENEGAMMKAMLLGDREFLDSKAKTALYRSGCGHIMAVSGIHMTVIYTFLISVLQRPAGRKTAFLITMAVLLVFCIMTGLSASAVRAYIMLFVLGSADFFGREGDTLNSLGLAGLIITGVSPFAIADCGLILSFAGVIGINVAAPKVKAAIEENLTDIKTHAPVRLTGIRENFVSSLCAFSVTLPVSMLFFDEVSLISPVTNTFLVPFCTASLMLGAVTAMTGGAAFIARPALYIASLMCKVVLSAAETLAVSYVFILPTGNIAVRLTAAAAVAALTAALIFYKNTARVCCAALAAVALTVIYRYICLSDSVKVAVLLDSSGKAVVIHNGSNAAVIDINNGSRSADKYLRQCGIYDIDMILSAKGSKKSEAYFGLYDVGEYLQAEDRAFYDCGYVKISVNNEKDMEISVQDKIFCITDDDVSDMGAFCTILPYSGEYTVYNSSYIIAADGSSCSADEAVYKNCCIEFTVDGQFTEGRSLYSGGNNRKHT